MSVEEYTYQFMELARYAPEEVDKDEKNQDMFKKGFSKQVFLYRGTRSVDPHGIQVLNYYRTPHPP